MEISYVNYYTSVIPLLFYNNNVLNSGFIKALVWDIALSDSADSQRALVARLTAGRCAQNVRFPNVYPYTRDRQRTFVLIRMDIRTDGDINSSIRTVSQRVQ